MKPMKITTELYLGNLIMKWCEGAGYFEDGDPNQAKYYDALQALGDLFVKHHKELPDGHFTRIYRFLIEFYDFDVTEFKYNEVNERFMKYLYTEVL